MKTTTVLFHLALLVFVCVSATEADSSTQLFKSSSDSNDVTSKNTESTESFTSSTEVEQTTIESLKSSADGKSSEMTSTEAVETTSTEAVETTSTEAVETTSSSEDTTTTNHETTTNHVTKPNPPPTAPSATDGSWNVESGENTCIMLSMAAQIHVQYNSTVKKMETAEFNVPKEAEVNTNQSICGKAHQVIQLDFNNNSLRFVFVQEKSKVYVDEIKLDYLVDEDHFPGSPEIGNTLNVNSSSTEFKTKSGNSLVCKSKQKITLGGGVVLVIHDLQVQAFMKVATKDKKFDTSEKCDADVIKTPVIVPIIVGCVLGGMLLIVIIAFLVGRRRFANRPYEDL